MEEKIQDFQEKYKDKSKEIRPKAVPLAADSAHLLTDYLDTINIQLVKHGVVDAYRIAREIEEICTLELQQLGAKSKLTYDVVSKKLEELGSPSKVVKNYIAEHQPKQETILAAPKTNSTGTEKSGFIEILWLYVFGLIMLGIIAPMIVIIPYIFEGQLSEDMIVVPTMWLMSVFILIEVFHGLTGRTGVSKKFYHQFRETTRFLLSFTTLLFLWRAADVYRSQEYFWEFSIVLMSVIWGAVYGIGFIKDHTEYLYSSAPKEKPIARFFLPSYVMTAAAYILVLVFLYLNADRSAEYMISPMIVSWIFIVIALVAEAGRKYPVSVKKLGYSMLFILAPFIAFVYAEEGLYSFIRITRADTSLLFAFVFFFGITHFFLVPLIFRSEIREQLEQYRLSLEDYRENS